MNPLEKQYESDSEKIGALQARIRELESLVKQEQLKNESYSRQLASREETNRQVTTALVEAEAQLTEMQKECDRLTNGTWSMEIGRRSKESMDLRERLSIAESKLAQIERERDSLAQQLATMREAVEFLKHKCKPGSGCHNADRAHAALSLPVSQIEAAWAGLRDIPDLLLKILVASEDGMRLSSCCGGKHLDTTLMSGDRIYRLSYAHADKFDKALSALDALGGKS